MRRYRMGLIQTADQLRFSYLAVIEGAKYIMGDTSVQVMLWDVKETNIFQTFKFGVLKFLISGLFAEGVAGCRAGRCTHIQKFWVVRSFLNVTFMLSKDTFIW